MGVLQMLELSIPNFGCKRIYFILSKHMNSLILPSLLQPVSQYSRIKMKPWNKKPGDCRLQ